ncbi:MAG: biotin--[acetyl-CoA-carboxylase] ligase [Planctomycetes bacterium]|nr:biotin--[acetyl-CoA-carboxylase] ligase [Planctomycetota bacterium]MCC7170955.1 biotin--[acetyl-CoA-carboxylase] ligase [Planctomycetota bacterium]
MIDDGLERLAGTHSDRRFGRAIEVHATATSTQDLAKHAILAAGSARDGLVVTTHEQTGGRGTRGRRWWSPVGVSLAVSIVAAPSRPLARPACVTQLAALAVVRAAALRGGAVRVRWPNDVVDGNGAKIAGVLAETMDGARTHVIGIGLNVFDPSTTPPEPLRERAGSMQSAGAAFRDLGDALDVLLRALDVEWDEFEHGGITALAGRMNANDGLRGREVELARGQQRSVGTFWGVDEDLAPRLLHADGSITTWPAEHAEVVAIDGVPRDRRG